MEDVIIQGSTPNEIVITPSESPSIVINEPSRKEMLIAKSGGVVVTIDYTPGSTDADVAAIVSKFFSQIDSRVSKDIEQVTQVVNDNKSRLDSNINKVTEHEGRLVKLETSECVQHHEITAEEIATYLNKIDNE